jgi:hypothetical protein
MAKKTPDTKTTKILRENLLILARVYAEAEGVTLAVVSARMYGNRQLIPAMGAGKQASLSIKSYGDVIERFRHGWPKGVDWPLLRTLFIGRFSREK